MALMSVSNNEIHQIGMGGGGRLDRVLLKVPRVVAVGGDVPLPVDQTGQIPGKVIPEPGHDRMATGGGLGHFC
jgi:hypothetical protein